MIAAPAVPRLAVEGVNTYYGDSHILRDMSLVVGAGETVALLGRNGVGKTTTLKSIVGWVPPRSGSVKLDGVELAGGEMMTIARRGVSLVPEERRAAGAEMQRVFARDLPSLPLLSYVSIAAKTRRLQGYVTNPTNMTDFVGVAHWWLSPRGTAP